MKTITNYGGDMKKAVYLFVLLMFLASCQTAQQLGESSKQLSNKEKAVALLNSLESGDPEPIGYINPKRYTQHNLMAGDGLAGFGELLKQVPQGSLKANVIRAYEDGDYVFTHTEYNFFGPKVGFDIFRFENGRIVEHWDNLAEIAAEPNPSGRTQFDGPSKAVDHAQTDANKSLIKDFIGKVLINGQFDKMGSYFDGDNYIQHNTAVPDGVSGLGKALEAMAKLGLTMVYQKNHMVLGEGNFVLAVSEGQFGGKHVAFYDLFRVKNGKIAEHWDVVEPILPKAQWKNNNGKF
jgi:predicted SnoaL-like aldol condensation-catalyzing enzyme